MSTRAQITALLCNNILAHKFFPVFSSVTDNYLPELQSVTAQDPRTTIKDYLLHSLADFFI
jgi:hypothetical protein